MTAWLRRRFELGGPARLLPMEGLRGVAVLLVFLQHVGAQGEGLLMPGSAAAPLMTALKQQGNVGVELFFVLSGYLIYGHLVARRPGFWAFLRRRAVRLYPAFLCAFALAWTIDVARAQRLVPADPVEAARYLAANLLFLPGLLRARPLLTVAWSLSYEAFFYLACFALVAGLALDRWGRGGRVALILGLAAAFEAVSWWHGPNMRGPMLLVDLADWDWPDRMLPFFAGMLLAEGGTRTLPSALGLAAPAAVVALLSWTWVPDLARGLLVAGGFFLLCAAAFRPGSAAARALSWQWLRWLGNMSFCTTCCTAWSSRPSPG